MSSRSLMDVRGFPRCPFGLNVVSSYTPASSNDADTCYQHVAVLLQHVFSACERSGDASAYSVIFGSASTSNEANSPRASLRRATSAIMAALSVQAP